LKKEIQDLRETKERVRRYCPNTEYENEEINLRKQKLIDAERKVRVEEGKGSENDRFMLLIKALEHMSDEFPTSLDVEAYGVVGSIDDGTTAIANAIREGSETIAAAINNLAQTLHPPRG